MSFIGNTASIDTTVSSGIDVAESLPLRLSATASLSDTSALSLGTREYISFTGIRNYSSG